MFMSCSVPASAGRSASPNKTHSLVQAGWKQVQEVAENMNNAISLVLDLMKSCYKLIIQIVFRWVFLLPALPFTRTEKKAQE